MQDLRETEGKVIFNEVDLMTLLVYPDAPDFYYLQRSFFDLQNYSGNGYIARQLGILLKQTGFNSIKITPWSYHYFEALEVKKFVDYVNEWLSVCLGQMVEKLNKDYDRLQSGLKFFQSLPELPESSITATIYRATAIK